MEIVKYTVKEYIETNNHNNMSGIAYPSYQSVGEIRAASILTGAYVVAKTWGQLSVDQEKGIESTHLVLDFDLTIGSLTSASIKVEYSDDGTTWFQHTSSSTSAGVSSISAQTNVMTASMAASLAIPLIKHPFVRVSAIGTGTATGSSLAISARFIS